MNSFLAGAVIVGVPLLLLVLPFMPGLIELRRRADVKPLFVDPGYEANIRHFAERFRGFVAANLGQEMDGSRASGRSAAGQLPDGTRFQVVAGNDGILGDEELRSRRVDKVIVSCAELTLPERVVFEKEVLSEGRLTGGEESVYRAVLGESDVSLARKSVVLRWLHANGRLVVDQDSSLFGRVSADRKIRLANGVRFLRLNAPRIEFEQPSGAARDPLAIDWSCAGNGFHLTNGNGHLQPNGGATRNQEARREGHGPGRGNGDNRGNGSSSPEEPHIAVRRWLVHGNLELPPGSFFHGNLVVRGWLQIGAGSRIEGSVKSHGQLTIGPGCCILGTVVSSSRLRLGADCAVRGPVIAEDEALIEEGCCIGNPDNPTTVTSRKITVSPGVVAFGTVWAGQQAAVSRPPQLEGPAGA